MLYTSILRDTVAIDKNKNFYPFTLGKFATGQYTKIN